MQTHTFDAVVFDLDGVLIDSRPQMEFVFRKCFEEFHDGGEAPVAAFFELMGMPLPDILRQLGLSPEMAPRYRQLSRQLYKQIRVVAGAHSTLAKLSDRGIRLGLMTGKDRLRTAEIITHHKLAQFFSEAVCGDDPYPGKPSPDGLVAIAKRFGVPLARVVLVGDSVLDVRCGLSAGAITVAAEWGFEQPARLANSGAHYRFATLDLFCAWSLSCIPQPQVRDARVERPACDSTAVYHN